MEWVRWKNCLLLQLAWVSGGGLLVVGIATPLGDLRAGGLGILLVAGVATLMERNDRNHRAQLEKIDASVGKVWDAGGRAERRRIDLEQSASGGLAVVREMPQR